MNAAEARSLSDQANTPKAADADVVSEQLSKILEQVGYRARRGHINYVVAGICAKPDDDIKHGATAKAIRKRLKELGFKVLLDLKMKQLEIHW